MPLKPMFSRAPLTRRPLAPLAPEHIRLTGAAQDTLGALCALAQEAPLTAGLCRGALQCAYLYGNDTLAERAEEWLRVQLMQQQENGALPGSRTEQVRLMLAASCLYAHTGDKTLLEQMMRFCAGLSADWEQVRLDGEVMGQAADLLELLIFLYDVTGKKALLRLMDLTRRDAMDWSGLLGTFALTRPTAKVIDRVEMEAGRQAEGNDPSGFYTRQYLATHGPALAQGIRFTALMGLYSGSARDEAAGLTGYERIMRYHGTPCGAFTSDLHLAGGSPSAAVSAQAAGETARALAQVWLCGGKPQAGQALAALMTNALPAFLPQGRLLPYLRTNSLSVNAGVKDCYAPEGTEADALAALMNGFAAAVCASCAMTEEGATLGLLLPGTYTLRLKGERVRLTVTGEGERLTLALHMKEAAEAALSLRIPAWAQDACVEVGSEGGDAPAAGSMFTLRRTFRDGDTVTMLLPSPLRVTEGYHQSVSVYRGDLLLALPAEEDRWRVALDDVEGTDTAVLRVTPAWKTRVRFPADPPIAPQEEGVPFTAELVPFAAAPCRIAAFPKGTKA